VEDSTGSLAPHHADLRSRQLTPDALYPQGPVRPRSYQGGPAFSPSGRFLLVYDLDQAWESGIQEAAGQLMEESSTTRENAEWWILMRAHRAAAAVECYKLWPGRVSRQRFFFLR